MVVHSKDLHRQAILVEFPGAIEDEVHNLAGLRMIQIFVDKFSTSACIDQVIEAYSRYLFLLDQVEYPLDVLDSSSC